MVDHELAKHAALILAFFLQESTVYIMANGTQSSSVLSTESVTSVDDSDESDIDEEEESHNARGESRAELESVKHNWYKY